ncbi:MAG TPA: hypothetical protein VFG69_03420 [Nannocystaceae bacterium]|nr:hypothetical protein [Nannocystaceae bacterium]
MHAKGLRNAIVGTSLVALASASACSFDASGNSRGLGVLQPADDDALDDSADDRADGSEDEPEPEPEPDDDGATRTDDGNGSLDDGAGDSGATSGNGDEGSVLETGAHDDGTTDDSGELDGGDIGTDDGTVLDDGDDDDAAPMCPVDVLEIVWADAAQVADPMQLLIAEDAMEDPEVAVSPVAEEGTVTFSLHFDCAGEYSVWGLVWDYNPGAYASSDPDSLYVGVGGPEPTWRYGCQTGNEESGLSWQRLRSLDAQPCDTSPLALVIAGETDVELTFRNREAGASSEIAGIAAIVVASDPSTDPYDLYAPY